MNNEENKLKEECIGPVMINIPEYEYKYMQKALKEQEAELHKLRKQINGYVYLIEMLGNKFEV